MPVTINLSIRSMGPVDENRMVFSLDCYFRQSWVDDRLRYNATGVPELALNWQFLAKIWVPDTVIVNGKESYLHKITVPNRFVRIYPNGRVSYSQRLTIWADCPMDLRKFPWDTQTCPLLFGSFNYDVSDIKYEWAEPKSVSIDKLGLAQFHLISFKSFETIGLTNRRTRYGFRNDSTAVLEFFFERQTGFFLLQIVTPLILIVFCSWVAFWLIKTEKGGEIPARTALGANAVLSVVNIGFGGKSRPSVGYATGLDIFIIICFISVFAALVEFACINFLDTFIKRRKAREEEMEKQKIARLEKKEAVAIPQLILAAIPLADAMQKVEVTEEAVSKLKAEEAEEVKARKIKEAAAEAERLRKLAEDDEYEDVDDDEEEEQGNAFLRAIDECTKRFYDRLADFLEARYGPLSETELYKDTTGVIWSIDEWAQILFPTTFLFMQFVYWTMYLYIM